MPTIEPSDLAWRRLVEERAAARALVGREFCAVRDRAKDPFGLRSKARAVKDSVKEHPAIAAAVAAGVGLLLTKFVVSRRRKRAAEREESECAEDGTNGAGAARARKTVKLSAMTTVGAALLGLGVRLAEPAITRAVNHRFGRFLRL